MNTALLMLSEGSTTLEPTTGNVIGGVVEKSGNFLDLVQNIGNICVNNEICMAFLTVTFVGLGVRILRKVIGAFGRGR